MTRAPLSLPEKTEPAIVLFVILLGGWTRLSAAYAAGFPINDGGLFYTMLSAIQNNHFILPQYIQYNGQAIPFVYPPFGFFVGAFFAGLLRVDLLQILQWLPSIVLIFTIPAFFWLAKPILKSSFTCGVATFIYAFTPNATNWAMMGGGLTRSFGILFLLFTIASLYRLFTNPGKKYLYISILFSSLTVLSHPEATLHAIGFAFFLWLFYGRNKTGIINSLLVGLGTLLLTAIWWVPITLHFGLTPFLAASQTGFYFPLTIFGPFIINLTREPQITFIAVLGLIGFAYSLSNKDYLLPGLYLLPFLVEARNSSVYSTIGGAMLAGIAISSVLLPAISLRTSKINRAAQIILIYLAISLMGNSFLVNTQLSNNTISLANRTAFEWIKNNTPNESRVLVLTNESEGFCDGVSEWFPVLAQRISPTTTQGLEWLPGSFFKVRELRNKVQACLVNTDSPECLNTLVNQGSIKYDFIYIARLSAVNSFCGAVPTTRLEILTSKLEKRIEYTIVYRTDQVVLFAYK